MSGIIDSHTHAFPAAMAKNPVAWATQRKERHWARLVGPRSIQGWATPIEMLDAMDVSGVDKAVLMGWYWERPETCQENNQWLQEWVAEAPDRFIALASFHPAGGQAMLDDLERRLDSGFCGVGELLPQVQGYGYDDPVFRELCACLQARDLPLNLHATDPASHDYLGKVETPFERFLQLATDFPDLKIILAHWGGGLPWTQNELPQNLYFDTAASPLLYDAAVWTRVVDRIGAERVLFGSDYPLRIYPRQEKAPEFRRLIAEAWQSRLDAKALDAIFSANARRVFQL